MHINKERLLLIMAKKSMPARELIEKSGLSENTIQRMMHGAARCNPSTAGKIAAALGCDVEDLVEID